MTKSENSSQDAVLSELSDIKLLLILQLLKLGFVQSEIALVLGIGQSTLSGMIPVRKIKTLSQKEPAD